jgi:hypothetical protein
MARHGCAGCAAPGRFVQPDHRRALGQRAGLLDLDALGAPHRDGARSTASVFMGRTGAASPAMNARVPAQPQSGLCRLRPVLPNYAVRLSLLWC